MKKEIAATFLVLLASAGVTIWRMLHAAGESPEMGIIFFIIWAISPYLCFWAAVYLLSRYTSLSGILVSGLVVSLLMLGFTVLTYVALDDTSSTYALVFIFVPIWLYIGGFGLLGISVFISWLTKRGSA
jgi:hypothetical protein